MRPRPAALALALAATACLLAAATPAAAAPSAAELADQLAERWAGQQRENGTFPDSIRPDQRAWGRYGEAGVGYGLMLAGVRSARPDWVEAGARAQAYAAANASDRLSVFESMLIASGYNLLRSRAPGTPTFAARRAVWERYMRDIKPVLRPRVDAPDLVSNKLLVEAVAYFELARSGLRSRVPGAVLSVRGAAHRRGWYILNRFVPKVVRTLRGSAAGHRTTALSDAGSQPLAYHSLTLGMLARAIDVAGRTASANARKALRIGTRTVWAYQAPDGDLAYFGRSQGQSWALALATYAAERASARSCDPRAHGLHTVAERALGRLATHHPIGPAGMPIVPSANGPATIPAIDNYASDVVYNGLTLTALGWAADGARTAPGCRAGTLLSDRGGGASFPFDRARFATLRSGRVWMAVKQASQPPDARYAFGLRALKYRVRGGGWTDLLPAAPPAPGAPSGTLGPALRTRRGALARPLGTSIDVRRRRIVVRGGWVLHGRWVRLGVRFRFVPTRNGARIVVPTRRGDRIVYSALTAGRPTRRDRGVTGADAGTRASAAARLRVRGPFASSSSLDVWRSDLEVRAAGRRVTFAIRAS